MRDLTGQRFGKLTALAASYRRQGRTFVRCKCDCGTTRDYMESNVLRGNTASCGCTTKEAPPARTHGFSKKIPEYSVWKAMRQRCLNPRSTFFYRYGGRGIEIDPAWDDFGQFLKAMGRRPSPEHTLDRIDNDLGYSKENCRWATRKEQTRNMSTNVLLRFDGVTRNVSSWEEALELPRGIIFGRLADGWSVERALTEPVQKAKRNRKSRPI